MASPAHGPQRNIPRSAAAQISFLTDDFIEGPIDGASFRTYVEKVLLPTLRPGDVVVLLKEGICDDS